ncbi:ribosome silencing factor [Helicobacter monodelphidis]|uniref:ribosome silencing factor n=1 Tax=Helicobacter sp. 15-1451 TaxID=2004995 RepID=UPI000DCC33B2|nr:ribosome silencing factor [Helicobacter sp. 15-1451]RAX57274.1 ribosome silencing factor [Helicobacter sp. 15-1451]
MDIQARVERIVGILDDKKAENIESFDLRDSGYFVDFVVIATALIDRHALSLLDTLKQELKPLGEEFLSVEEGQDWIVVDMNDILVHIFTENHRKKFNLEEFLLEFCHSKCDHTKE